MFARAAASVILAGTLVMGTAGCAFITTPQTRVPYDQSDGVNVTVGSVKLSNVMALVSGDGQAVSLLTTISNKGDKAVKVNFAVDVDGEQQTKDVVVGAGKSSSFGYDPEASDSLIVFIGADATAGSLLPVFVQYGNETGETILVPVLDGSLPEYADLVPPLILR